MSAFKLYNPDWIIFCGRGNHGTLNPIKNAGNINFRKLIEQSFHLYESAGMHDKRRVSQLMVEKIRNEYNGAFLINKENLVEKNTKSTKSKSKSKKECISNDTSKRIDKKKIEWVDIGDKKYVLHTVYIEYSAVRSLLCLCA